MTAKFLLLLLLVALCGCRKPQVRAIFMLPPASPPDWYYPWDADEAWGTSECAWEGE